MIISWNNMILNGIVKGSAELKEFKVDEGIGFDYRCCYYD